MKITCAIPTIKKESEIKGLIEDIIKKAFTKVEVVVSSSGGSAAYNRNRCLDKSTGDIIIMIDDDIENIPKGFDAEIVKQLENPDVLIVGARLMNVDGSVQRTSSFDYELTPEIREVKKLPSAFIGFRKTNIMFDENYRAWGYEDTDFCEQLLQQKKNGKFIICNNLQVTHRNEEKNKNVAAGENEKYFTEKWRNKKKIKTCAVIIPAYKSKNFIQDCLRSYDLLRPVEGWVFELRLGVDGCKDTSEEIKRKHFFSEKNHGGYLIRNSLIEIGYSDAYCYFDSDDIFHADFLEKCLEQIDKGFHLVMPAKTNISETLKPLKTCLERGGAMVFSHTVWDVLGGFYPERLSADQDFLERAELAGLKIKNIRIPLYLRRVHAESLTQSPETAIRSTVRNQIWAKMKSNRDNLKIKCETVELRVVDNQKKDDIPFYILMRTSNRTEFFKNAIESIKKQTYKNIKIIVHSDNKNDKYIDEYRDIIFMRIDGRLEDGPNLGNAPYNLYCNKMLESIPEGAGWYFFLDDDDEFIYNDSISDIVKNCQRDKLNVFKTDRGNNTFLPEYWGQDVSFQSQCFCLHTDHKLKAQWWDKKTGDHFYTKQLTTVHKMKINWIDIMPARAQEGRGVGLKLDKGEAKRDGNNRIEIPVLFLKNTNKINGENIREGEIRFFGFNLATKIEAKKIGKIIDGGRYSEFKAEVVK